MTSLRCIRRRRVCATLSIFSCLCLAWVLSTPAVAQNENERVGFSSTHIFDGGYFGDNIDLLNGNLTFTVPIGPKYQVNSRLDYQLQLVYNSKVWEYLDTSGSPSLTVLWGESPMGLGFTLTFGRVYKDLRSDGTSQWFFVTADGNRHEMGPATGSAVPLVTNDTTYFSPQLVSSATRTGQSMVVITDRKGLRYTLDHQVDISGGSCDACLVRQLNGAYGGWYVTRIEDTVNGTPDAQGRYPNRIDVSYNTTLGYGQCIASVTDTAGRTIAFHSDLMVAGDPRSARINSIDVPKTGGGVATYNFSYTHPTVLVPIVSAFVPLPEIRPSFKR